MYLFSLLLASALQVFATSADVTGTIYIGDSRFVGMEQVCHMSDEDNTWTVAKAGEGLSWLKKDGMSEVTEIVSNNEDITEWTLVIGLGVNDLHNVNKYLEYYDTLSENYNIILLTVNPVDEKKCDIYGYDYEELSTGINKFNDRLKSSDYEYVDTYTELVNNGFSAIDGLHYTDDTYRAIFSLIVNSN